MDAKLIIVGGKANKSEIRLRLPTVIGRSRDAGLTMAHPMVSRQHCELFEEGGLLKIRDLGSLNGTFVGKQQVRQASLYPNGEFTVGPLTFRVLYEYSGEVPLATAPPPGSGPAVAEVDPAEVELADFQPAESPPEPSVEEGRPPGIAPAGGELPDFAAWDAAEAEAGLSEEPAEVAPAEGFADQAEPSVSSGGPPAASEVPTDQFDALNLPPPGSVSPPGSSPGPNDVHLAEEETERTSPADEESMSEGRPGGPESQQDDPPESDQQLDDFLKGPP